MEIAAAHFSRSAISQVPVAQHPLLDLVQAQENDHHPQVQLAMLPVALNNQVKFTGWVPKPSQLKRHTAKIRSTPYSNSINHRGKGRPQSAVFMM